MSRSSLAASALSVLLSIAMAGCAEDDSHLKEWSRYTPENLSQEWLLRGKAALKRPPADSRARAAAKSGRSLDDGDKEGAAAARYGDEYAARDADGGARGMSLEDLAANIARKARLIEGLGPREVLARLTAAVDADVELAEAEKSRLKIVLEKAFAP